MNSPFATIFLAVQQRIQSSVTSINYTDQDLGQLNTPVRPGVLWPCALIDFDNFTFNNMGSNVQTASGAIVIRLALAAYSNSSQGTPGSFVQQALAYYDVEYALHQALQGWSPGDCFGHLCRTSVATLRRTDNIRVRELRYSIAFEDYSAKQSDALVTVGFVVQDQITL